MRVFAAFLFLVFNATHAWAQSAFGPFLYDPSAPNVLILNGEIGPRTALEFRRALKANPGTNVLALNSGGGLVNEALLVADDVNQRGIATFIPSTGICASACSFIYLAGAARVIEGKLGVHQMFGVDDASAVQVTLSDIVEALTRYETPNDVLAIMLRTPPNQMYFFTPEEVVRFGLNRVPGQTAYASSGPDMPKPPAPPSPPPVATQETRAMEFLTHILEIHSAASAGEVNGLAPFYVTSPVYFGETTPLPTVLRDKAAYFAKWPVRSTRVRLGTVRIDCAHERCKLMGEYDWEVSRKGAHRSGVALFHY